MIEPTVTISLEEYNSLLKLKDQLTGVATKWADDFRSGIVTDWNDISESHKFLVGRESFTFTRVVSRDAGRFSAEEWFKNKEPLLRL